jgi:Integrase zinc binding domain
MHQLHTYALCCSSGLPPAAVGSHWLFYSAKLPAAQAEFGATLWHVSGAAVTAIADVTAVAAAQSPPPQTGSLPVDIRDLAAAQRSCQDFQQATTSPALTVLTAELDVMPVLVDVSSGVFHPVVPANFRRRIFEAVHNLSHADVRATRCLIASRYVWPGLATDVRTWCRTCQRCNFQDL